MLTNEKKSSQENEVLRSVEYLLDENQVVETRVPKVVNNYGYSKLYSGYFDNYKKLASEVIRLENESQKVEAFYFTLNPIDKSLLARSCNKLIPTDTTTSGNEIIKRRWLPVDVDPVRAKGISSTNLQHEQALALIREIANWLKQNGWPNPVYADSGNGAHLLYRADLPPDDDGIVRNILNTLASRFNSDDLKVDTANHDPNRIWKLYGTMARKGSDLDEYPHRLSQILWHKSPDKVDVVDRVLLEKIACMASPPQQKELTQGSYHQDGRFNLENWLSENRDKIALKSGRPLKLRDDVEMWALSSCPFHNDHRNSTYIYRYPSGAVWFKCFGDRCSDKGWHEFRELIQPGYKSKAVYSVPPEDEKGTFFLDTKLQVYTYIDMDREEMTYYKNKGDWQNKYKLLNNSRHMPEPYDDCKSIYDPTRGFGFFNDDFGERKFNRFKPSEFWFREYPNNYNDDLTPVFDALYTNVFGDDTTVMFLLAKMLQDHKRFLIIPVCINEEGGAGKGIFENHVLRPIFGDQNCSLNLGQEDLESKYNDYIIDKLYVGFHETEDMTENAGLGSKTMRKIKRMYDDTITIEKKYVDRTKTVNHATCFIYSNNSNPLSVPVHDRRTYVIRSNKMKLEEAKKFRQKNEDTKNRVSTFQKRLEELHNEIPDLVFMLKNMYIPADFGKIPQSTNEKKDLQDRSMGPIQNFIKALLEFDLGTLKAMSEEKGGEFPAGEFDVLRSTSRLTTNSLRIIAGKISKGRWTYETVRRLMPPIEDKKYHGFKYWNIEINK
ncbi:MAG: hypothetical protein GY861_20280 [bacterium]|nr:hypothetical protein [bacterium]